MKFVADLHLHSKYSRAVSQRMIFSNMVKWAKYKGINVLATGDFTHPFWLETIKSELEEAGNGLYRLKEIASSSFDETQDLRSSTPRNDILFMLSCEVSSIYSQGGKTRRVHNLFMFPTVDAVEKFDQELLKRGSNLRSDGRPIVDISSRDLADIALLCDEKALIIPAHAWTPWFSVFGSFSGFDSIEECFGDMAKYIYGIETGLSSDPTMNWCISGLDDRAILSFSDAHSLEKMGREVTVFKSEEISYDSIYDAIRGVGSSKIAFTIEFYPEEGKYHFTGHRNCNFSQSPEETKQKGSICPVCNRPLTIGVMHRMEQLKTRNSLSVRKRSQFEIRNSNGMRWVNSDSGRPGFVSMVPLNEILAEALGVGTGTQKVYDAYLSLVGNLGSEFSVLMKAGISDIANYSNGRVAEAIAKVRKGELVIEPGYDGKFGIVKIWKENADKETGESKDENQLNLFA